MELLERGDRVLSVQAAGLDLLDFFGQILRLREVRLEVGLVFSNEHLVVVAPRVAHEPLHVLHPQRESNTFSPTLLCVACACKSEKKTDDVDAGGYRSSEYGRTDQIGFYVPAVPDEEGTGYWGYTTVPEAGVNWWRGLPTRPATTTAVA